jgi:hypothetical protein
MKGIASRQGVWIILTVIAALVGSMGVRSAVSNLSGVGTLKSDFTTDDQSVGKRVPVPRIVKQKIDVG